MMSRSLSQLPLLWPYIHSPLHLSACLHHDNETLLFIPPADGCATFKISKDPFSLCIYAAFPKAPKNKIHFFLKRCVPFESHKQVLIDNTIPRNCTVMVTSAAKRSISHDLQWGHSVVREGTPNKTIISARFPHRSPTIHHCFIKIEKGPDCIQPLRAPLLANRWLIIAPAVVYRRPSPILQRHESVQTVAIL